MQGGIGGIAGSPNAAIWLWFSKVNGCVPTVAVRSSTEIHQQILNKRSRGETRAKLEPVSIFLVVVWRYQLLQIHVDIDFAAIPEMSNLGRGGILRFHFGGSFGG